MPSSSPDIAAREGDGGANRLRRERQRIERRHHNRIGIHFDIHRGDGHHLVHAQPFGNSERQRGPVRLHGGFGRRFRVKCDGVTNDTSAPQTALTSPGKVGQCVNEVNAFVTTSGNTLNGAVC